MPTDNSGRSLLRLLVKGVVGLILLTIAVILVLNSYAKRNFDAAVQRIVDRGIPTTLEGLQALTPDVRDSYDAMPIYREADNAAFAEAISLCSRTGDAWECEPYTTRTGEQQREIFDLNKTLDPWRERILAATELPAVRIAWEDIGGVGVMGQSSHDMGTLARVMRYLGNQAYQAAREHDGALALEFLTAQVNLFKQMDSAHFLVGQMWQEKATAILSDTFSFALEEQEWSADELDALTDLLAVINMEEVSSHTLATEAGYAAYLGNSMDMPIWMPRFPFYFANAEFLSFEESITEGGPGNFTLNRDVLDAAKNNLDDQGTFARMMIPSLARTIHSADQLAARLELLQIGIEIRQYKIKNNTYPNTLEDLPQESVTTPLADASPYTYRTDQLGFVLSYTDVGGKEYSLRIINESPASPSF